MQNRDEEEGSKRKGAWGWEGAWGCRRKSKEVGQQEEKDEDNEKEKTEEVAEREGEREGGMD